MKKVLDKLIKPTNRGVRIFVGLLLVVLLCVQVTQSVATHQDDGRKLSLVDGSTNNTIQELAENDHVKLLEMCLSEFKKRGISSYTCTFVKQEKIRGRLSKEQHIKAKFMAKPFSVAMRWFKNPPTGDVIVYVKGKYRDTSDHSQMIVRPTSVFLQKLTGGSVLRLPDGPDARRNTLRPVTMFGFENSIKSLLNVYRNAEGNGDCTKQFGGFAEVDGRKCIVLVRFLPDGKKYPAKKTIICIDLEYLLPVRVIGYDWDDKLICNYEYRDVNFDITLQPEDFTPQANGIRTR